MYGVTHEIAAQKPKLKAPPLAAGSAGACVSAPAKELPPKSDTAAPCCTLHDASVRGAASADEDAAPSPSLALLPPAAEAGSALGRNSALETNHSVAATRGRREGSTS